MSKRSLAAVLLSIFLVLIAAPIASADHQLTPPGLVRVIEVNGYIDPTSADFVRHAIDVSEKANDEVLVIQLDSHGSLLSNAEFQKLLDEVKTAAIPIAVWVGGVGAVATNESFEFAKAADIIGVAPATAIGPSGNTMNANEALKSNTAQINAPVLQQFIFLLDDRVLDGKQIHTATIDKDKPGAKPEISANILFLKPSLVSRLMHAAASPSIAYLFLVIALCLLIFEFFSLGVGAAAATALLLLIPSAYGLDVLPVRVSALSILVAAFAAFAIDIQAQASRAWTLIGTAMFIVGSLFIYDGVALPWVTFIPVVFLVLIFVLAAMPSTIRSRFMAPTAGRDWLIGEMGTATSDVDPDGTIDIRGGVWTARTNRATPISAGEKVRVLSIEGSVLEVEPEVGGARESNH